MLYRTPMGWLKIVGVTLSIYVGLVAVFPGAIGYFQPNMEDAIRIITTDSKGQERERLLAAYWWNDKLYVGSNFWLRGWYNHALENSGVQVTINGKRGSYTAVPIVQGMEYDQLSAAYAMGFVDSVLCGFASSKFLRLDPVVPSENDLVWYRSLLGNRL